MQPSELVTDDVWQKFLAEHHAAAGIVEKKGGDATRMALEAVALDFYEQGKKDGRDDGLEEAAQYMAKRILEAGDKTTPAGILEDAKAILKLRSAT